MKTNTDVSKALASKLSPVALAVAMTVPAISNIAVAQEAEATEEQQFEAITVTATKRPQVIYEVPIAISAFDGDKLADQGITDLTDVGKFVPNLNVTTSLSFNSNCSTDFPINGQSYSQSKSSVRATGGVDKGQGRIPSGLMSRRYKAFLVEP